MMRSPESWTNEIPKRTGGLLYFSVSAAEPVVGNKWVVGSHAEQLP